MKPGYRTVFDLTAHPDRIEPPYGFYAVFLVAGAILLALAIASIRFRWRRRSSLSIFAGVWVCLCGTLIAIDARDVVDVRSAVLARRLERIEGCLAYFRPGLTYGTKTTAGNEVWSVRGAVFSYGAGEARAGYHLVEPSGGVVHPDSRVKVFFVTSPAYGRKEIVRIDVAGHGCPSARRVEPLTEP